MSDFIATYQERGAAELVEVPFDWPGFENLSGWAKRVVICGVLAGDFLYVIDGESIVGWMRAQDDGGAS